MPISVSVNHQPVMADAADPNAGDTYISLPAQATVRMLTPVADVLPRYAASQTVAQVTMKIFANGIDLTTNTPEFCVGQATTNQAVFNPPLPAGTTVGCQWSASLDFINVITPPATNEASTSYALEPSAMTNSTVPIWWCTGGYKYIYCTATVQLPNGQTATIIGRGNVSVVSPTVTSFTDNPPSYATNATVDGGLSLSLGDGNSHGDMQYKVGVTTTNAGTIGIVQLINRNASNGSFGSGSLSTSGQFWLDGSFPYETAGVSLIQETFINFDDGPYVADVASGLTLTTSCTDQFIDYVVFRPNAGNVNNNIWVTLGIVSGGSPSSGICSWGWSASTTWLAGWSAPTGTVTRPTQPSNTDTFPAWQNTYQP